MRQPLAFSTSCALAWCVPIRTASAANPTSMLRLMKPTSAAGPVAKVGASITRSSWPVLSKFGTANRAQVSPHISNRPKYFREQRLSIQHGGEGFHQWKQAAFRHGGDQV